jgi:N-methylhydantoinase A
MQKVSVHYRRDLAPGSALRGPALIAEDETTIVVPSGWSARVDALDTIVIEKDEA